MGKNGVCDALRDEDSEGNSDDLSDEHKTRRDLHVVTQFQTGEIVGSHLWGPAEIRLEEHERDGLTRGDVTTQELREIVKGEPLVGDSANDAEGNDEAHSEEDGDDESPDGEAGREDLHANARCDEAENEEEAVPPHWHLGVGQHEATMDIAILLPRRAELTNDIAAVPNYRNG